MSDVLRISVDGHVAQVVLNRPDKHNAVNLEMFEALGSTTETLAADRTVRAVVLSAEGEHFCAGLDTTLFGAGDTVLRPEMFTPGETSPANIFQRAAYGWRELPVPVICAIRGVAFGAGLQIALGADLRIATPDARLSVMEIKWGLIPDMAITTTLRDIMPADQARALVYSGRIVNAMDALELGLVTEVHDDPVEAALEQASVFASKSPDAIRAAKQLLNRAWRANDAEALQLEAQLQAGIIGGANQREAVKANIERREPDFKD